MLVIGLAIVVGAVLQRTAGVGFALMVAPVAVAVAGPISGVLLTNLVAAVSAFAAVLFVWRRIDWRIYGSLTVAAVPGVAVGAWLTSALDLGWLELTIGVMVLAGVAVTVALPERRPSRDRPVTRSLAGVAAGTMSATTGAGGPFIVVYATVARWPFSTLAATLQPYFATVACMSFAAKLAVGASQWPLPLRTYDWVTLAVALLAGACLAHVVAGRVPVPAARAVALLVAAVGAGAAVLRGVLDVF